MDPTDTRTSALAVKGGKISGVGRHDHMDRDIASIPPEQTTHARVVMTIVGGRVVYEADVSG